MGRSVRHAVCAAVIFHQNYRIHLQALSAGSISGFLMLETKNILEQAGEF